MSKKKSFVLDTSGLMTDLTRDEGESVEIGIESLLNSFRDVESEFYMPVSTFEELEHILKKRNSEELVNDLRADLEIKQPSRYEVEIPGEFLYRFVEEMRERVNKGLRISEEAVKKDEGEVEEPENEHISSEDVIISDLRDKYKKAMRKELIDSRQDVDVLLLAREIEGEVVTEDRGIIEWCEDMGISYIRGRDFPKYLEKME